MCPPGFILSTTWSPDNCWVQSGSPSHISLSITRCDPCIIVVTKVIPNTVAYLQVTALNEWPRISVWKPQTSLLGITWDASPKFTWYFSVSRQSSLSWQLLRGWLLCLLGGIFWLLKPPIDHILSFPNTNKKCLWLSERKVHISGL